MNNEGWIYIGWDSKDDEYIKIGLTSDNNTYSRSHSSQNPDYGIELAIKVDNYKEIECIIHNLFERKPFRKTKNKSEFCKTTLEKIFPLFLILANDIKIEDEKRGQTFIKVAEMVENNLEQYKKITKPFVVNKINKLLKEGGVPVEDFYVEEETPKEKIEPKKQPILQNKVCKYIKYDKNGGTYVDWYRFVKDYLANKKAYVKGNPQETGIIVVDEKGYRIKYNGKRYRFEQFIRIMKNTKSRYNATEYICIADAGKTIKEIYNELTNKCD